LPYYRFETLWKHVNFCWWRRCRWWCCYNIPYGFRWTPDAAKQSKYRRYINSAKQVTPQCASVFGWLQFEKWTSWFFLGWNARCQIHDWDLVSGLGTLRDKAQHATRNTYWVGLDAAKVDGGSEGSVINLYKETAVGEFQKHFRTISLGPLINWLERIPFLGWLVKAFFFLLCVFRRLDDVPLPALIDDGKIALPTEAAEGDTHAPRRLGTLTRVGLHHAALYTYWTSRSICEELGAENCDCANFCLAWGDANQRMQAAGRYAAGEKCDVETNGYNVCGASNVRHFCSDRLWQAGACDCMEVLKDTLWCPKPSDIEKGKLKTVQVHQDGCVQKELSAFADGNC